MAFWQSMNGTVRMKLICADPPGVLWTIHQKGIEITEVSMPDDMTLLFSLRRQDARRLEHFLKNKGVAMERVGHSGIYWAFRSLLRRPVLVGGMVFLLLISLYLPTRVYFFRVEGNETIPTRYILEQADLCGLSFGASRREVRSEKVKNALLEAVPQLQWAGVNTSGCVATISVRERKQTPARLESSGVSSIVATQDGVIQEVTVTGGSALCKVGQAVKAGQILVSGYTDCGISIRAERAKGEVYAVTRREITASIPTEWVYRGEKQTETKKYSLIIGKNRINFYKESGNLDTGCVKMYSEKYVTLPGGFQLPLAIVTETWISSEATSVSASVDHVTLSDAVRAYLCRTMIAGRILSEAEAISQEDGVCVLEGVYECLEMIGQEQNEEIIEP